jgi:hypothetical protein
LLTTFSLALTKVMNQKIKFLNLWSQLISFFFKDSSGYLDFNEFLVSYSATQIGETSKKLEMVFSFYDKDKNGFNKEFFIKHSIHCKLNYFFYFILSRQNRQHRVFKSNNYFIHNFHKLHNTQHRLIFL